MGRRGRPRLVEDGVKVCAVLSKRHIKDALELGGGNASKGLRMAIDRYQSSLYPEKAILRYCVAVQECARLIDIAMDALQKTDMGDELYAFTKLAENSISIAYNSAEKMGLFEKDYDEDLPI